MKADWLVTDFFLDNLFKFEVRVQCIIPSPIQYPGADFAYQPPPIITIFFNDRCVYSDDKKLKEEITNDNLFDFLRKSKDYAKHEIDRYIKLRVPKFEIARKIDIIIKAFDSFDSNFYPEISPDVGSILLYKKPIQLEGYEMKNIDLNSDPKNSPDFRNVLFEINLRKDILSSIDRELSNAYQPLRNIVRDFYLEFNNEYSKYLKVIKTQDSNLRSFLLNPSKRKYFNIMALYHSLRTRNFIDDRITADRFRKVFTNDEIKHKIVWTGKKKELRQLINDLIKREIIVENNSKNKWLKTVYCFSYRDVKSKEVLDLKVNDLQRTKDPADKKIISDILNSAITSIDR